MDDDVTDMDRSLDLDGINLFHDFEDEFLWNRDACLDRAACDSSAVDFDGGSDGPDRMSRLIDTIGLASGARIAGDCHLFSINFK